ncbi:MAG: methyltransferase domain-containing protein [Formivibrio sp.]|nr:methyltransferase domain-containing protein [Formivibrio sp.]
MEWALDRLIATRNDFLSFRCNVCGKHTSFLLAKLTREYRSCVNCGSSVRQRSLINALSTELFGTSIALPDFPIRADLVGIGLTDWEGYSDGLAEKLSYTNTYYHQEPFLDIMTVDPSHYGRYDFIIASDVFEHICPPISKAFDNALLLLKPGGVMIFTVPYVEGESTEHFPELNRFSLCMSGDRWVLVNETSDGRIQEYSDLIFHGGPGSVLEMRLFGKDALMRHARNAGFGAIQIYDAEYSGNGIVWPPCIAENAPYCFPVLGNDTPPWAFRNNGSH